MDYTAWKRQIFNKVGKKVKSRGWSKPQPPQHKGSQMKPRDVVRYKVTLDCAGKKGLSGGRVNKGPSDMGL